MVTGLSYVNPVAETVKNLLLAGKRFFDARKLGGRPRPEEPRGTSATPHAGFPTGGEGGFDTTG